MENEGLKTVIAQQYITLSELLSDFKKVVKDKYYDKRFWVVAEIAKINVSKQSNHCYLELVEKEELSTDTDICIKSKVDAVIWASNFLTISENFNNVTGEDLKEGIKILFNCQVDFHQVYGLKLIINSIKPEFTVGEMHLKKEAIIKRLERENLINLNKQLQVPVLVQKMAIVSSVTSAGLEDFINHIDRNVCGFKFYYYVFNATVQGEDAVNSIINALSNVEQYKDFFDIVVIIRGGGSKVDLACFDSYDLAKRVAEFPLPVITGIGHTRDISCVDLVAHSYFKTPTACAEFIVEKASDFYAKVVNISEVIPTLVGNLASENNNLLDNLAIRLNKDVQSYITGNMFTIQETSFRLSGVSKVLYDKRAMINSLLVDMKNAYTTKTKDERFALYDLYNRLLSVARTFFKEERNRLKGEETKVKILDPKNVLQRGYSITYYKNKPLRKISGLKKNVEITTQLYDGKIASIVRSTGK